MRRQMYSIRLKTGSSVKDSTAKPSSDGFFYGNYVKLWRNEGIRAVLWYIPFKTAILNACPFLRAAYEKDGFRVKIVENHTFMQENMDLSRTYLQ